MESTPRNSLAEDIAQRWRLQIAADMRAAAAELSLYDAGLAAAFREHARRWEAVGSYQDQGSRVRRFQRVK